MKRGETPYEDALREERRGKALALRKAGKSYREIGKALEVDPMTAFADVQACFRELKGSRESIEEQRDLELTRLDRYLVALEGRIDGPVCEQCGAGAVDVKAIDAAVKIGKRRSELKGLDAPTKTQELPATPLGDEELLEQLAEAKAKVEARLAEKAQANGKVH